MQESVRRYDPYRKMPSAVYEVLRTSRLRGGGTPAKPIPMDRREFLRAAAAANCGATEMLYARVVCCMKVLMGIRNDHFAEWLWRDLKFVKTKIRVTDRDGNVKEEVRSQGTFL
jgi:hypothetical protein